MDIKLTPMLQQYRRIKKSIPEGAVLMFRLGDFYEMFFEDAEKTSKILNIALTRRGRDEGRDYPMCGIPYHAAEGYIGKLIRAGLKVAVCDQVEDPKLAKGIVQREITRFITPGTVLDSQILEEKRNNFLAAFNKLGAVYGFCFLDLSTGEFKVTEINNEEDFFGEFLRVSPAECILPMGFKQNKAFLERISQNGNVMLNFYEDWLFLYDSCYGILRDYFRVESLDGFGCQGFVTGVTAAGVIIHYLKENLYKSLEHIKNIIPYHPCDYMVLDARTIINLELSGPAHDNNKSRTLFTVLDHTSTSMGGRLLANWLRQPLVNVKNILLRQYAVEELHNKKKLLGELTGLLKEIPDIERLMGRLGCGFGNARDMVSIKLALIKIPVLKKLLSPMESELIKELVHELKELPELVDMLDRALLSTLPVNIRDGGFIKEGFNKELDDLRAISREAKGWLSSLELKEIERTGIKSLKVRYNKVFGYYIEVTKPNLSLAPQDYIRKQTMVNAERFIIPELKEYETKVLNAEEESFLLEQRIFLELRQCVVKEAGNIQNTAKAIAILDALSSLAAAALQGSYVFPKINDGPEINIVAGRHPVLERYMEEGKRFVSNDILIDSSDNQLILITGPNMAGKSTYIRQVALLTLMAQIGSAIPVQSAVIGVVDRIFTRVGASDEIARGKSTFMVEMNETAYILNNATPKSLIVLDEIGRGTSTFDGISIAWATSEYLLRGQKIDNGRGGFLGPKTLFATHYHELTELARVSKGVRNYNVAVREWNDEIIFLYKIVPGGTDKSYGIHVARLAGLPYAVLERAKEILAGLEEGSISWKKPAPSTGPRQLYLFDTPSNQIVEELRGLKLDYLTPIEALNKLKGLKEKVTGKT